MTFLCSILAGPNIYVDPRIHLVLHIVIDEIKCTLLNMN